jgi:hypothetical protein
MSKVSRREILQSGAIIAAGSLLLKPSLAHSELLTGALEKATQTGVIPAMPEIDLHPREHLLFDFDWRFFQGHATDPATSILRILSSTIPSGALSICLMIGPSSYLLSTTAHSHRTASNLWAENIPRQASAGIAARSLSPKRTKGGASTSTSMASSVAL